MKITHFSWISTGIQSAIDAAIAAYHPPVERIAEKLRAEFPELAITTNGDDMTITQPMMDGVLNTVTITKRSVFVAFCPEGLDLRFGAADESWKLHRPVSERTLRLYEEHVKVPLPLVHLPYAQWIAAGSCDCGYSSVADAWATVLEARDLLIQEAVRLRSMADSVLKGWTRFNLVSEDVSCGGRNRDEIYLFHPTHATRIAAFEKATFQHGDAFEGEANLAFEDFIGGLKEGVDYVRA